MYLVKNQSKSDLLLVWLIAKTLFFRQNGTMTIDLKDWIPLDYVPQQSALWHTKARFVCVVAPRQSGKSLLCFRKIILEALRRQGRYIYVLPTINQARKVCWKRMCEMLKPLQTEVLAMNKSELAFYFKNGSILTLESGEKREEAAKKIK